LGWKRNKKDRGARRSGRDGQLDLGRRWLNRKGNKPNSTKSHTALGFNGHSPSGRKLGELKLGVYAYTGRGFSLFRREGAWHLRKKIPEGFGADSTGNP